MTYPIQFAGLYLKWDEAYIKIYTKKLEDMGFYTKSILFNEDNIIAYSHRPFSRNEANSYLSRIIEGKEE